MAMEMLTQDTEENRHRQWEAENVTIYNVHAII